MAERRMFSRQIIDSDLFLDMPSSTQILYFHLAMRADDDGFVANPRKIQKMIGAGEDDGKILIAKNFLIGFDSGVIVITHWRMHNYLRKDRYQESIHWEEKKQLFVQKNNKYTLNSVLGQPLVDQRLPQVRLDKVSEGEETLSHAEEENLKEFKEKYIKKFNDSGLKIENINGYKELEVRHGFLHNSIAGKDLTSEVAMEVWHAMFEHYKNQKKELQNV